MSIIDCEKVSFTYNEGTTAAVKAVKKLSFGVEEGEFVALCGHNGSGKSTVAKLLNGLIAPTSGKITVLGFDTADVKTHYELRSNVGVVFQNPDNQMVATIIEDDIAFGPENLGLQPKEIRERVDYALKCVGMYEHRDGSPYRLSGGQKQRIAIAGVLALRPKIMVLDEATSMLDPRGRQEIMDVVLKLNKEEKMTVVMITHFMEEAALADRMIIMNDGELYLQGGSEVFSREEELRAIGLDIPVACRIAHRLRDRGCGDLGNPLTNKELVERLCRLK